MKIVDKDGKLFGKINIMDIIIILLILVIIVTLANKLNNKDSNNIVTSSSNKEVYIVAEAYSQAPEIVKSIVKGDTLVAQNKYQSGSIDYVEVRDSDFLSTNKKGKLIREKDTSKKVIEVGIKCKANISGPYIDCGGQELKVGLPYWIKTKNGQIQGFIKDIKLEQ
ncbi:MAG: DUF4330 domain-containing protein [Vallitalea sp.]|jgi:hypothetical protein|nr:DUF4330 domain-containing protein [Vallitalea sp.]